MLLNKSSKASLSVVVLVGELIGSFFFSALADSNGRRIGSILSCSMITIFSWLSGISGSFESLLLNRLLVGFGMGGDENAFTLEDYAPAFNIAAKAGYPCTVHAGELCGPESVCHVLLNLLCGCADYVGTISYIFNDGLEKFYSLICWQITFAIFEALELSSKFLLFYSGFFPVGEVNAPITHNFE